MRSLPARLEGPLVLEPTVHADDRGFFVEVYRESWLREAGVGVELLQQNHSRSRRGVVRGLHLQAGDGIGKLVRCARGTILDVVVDVRTGSPTYGEWEAFELDDRDHRQVWCPVGFAHGFCVLSDVADVIYAQSGYYAPELERSVHYADPDIAISWPHDLELTVSDRDAAAGSLRDLASENLFAYAAGRARA